MMKRFVSLVLAAVMGLALCLPAMATEPATAPLDPAHPVQTLTFNGKNAIQDITYHEIKLNAFVPPALQKDGWSNFELTCMTEYRIKCIEAVVVTGGSDFGKVVPKYGTKRESGSVPDGSTVHIDGIHSRTFYLDCCKGTSKFSSITVYYEKCVYIDDNGQKVEAPDGLKELTADTVTLTDGWYLVDSKVDFGNTRLSVEGASRLILRDGCGITTSGGIHVNSHCHLYVYSETIDLTDPDKMGYINVTGAPTNCAGIGGDLNEEYVRVEIRGGNVASHGGISAAGIGTGKGGQYDWVWIYNGFVRAWGGDGGAGIGGGAYRSSVKESIIVGVVSSSFCQIEIYNGHVVANGTNHGAGIGSGYCGQSVVNIHGGTIEARGGNSSEDIGKGGNSIASRYPKSTSTVSISEDAVIIPNGAASVFSVGSIFGIIAVAVVILAGVAALVIVKKKKKN